MINMSIYLKSGQVLTYTELNKVFVEDGYMTLSTFKGQYLYLNTDDIAGFELKYPQSKSPKAYAMFKQITDQLNGKGDINGTQQ